MLNYSLDFSMSSLIAICTIRCLYKLFVQIGHDSTITSCLYVPEICDVPASSFAFE